MDRHNLPDHVQMDFNDAFLGEEIGHGASRAVFEYRINPKFVVKVEYEDDWFQNVIEWETWNEIKFTKWAKWFAPCANISKNGRVLMQAKTTPVKKFPEQIPNFLTDLKAANFGMYKGHICAHDYGLNLLTSNGIGNARMKKAHWW